MREQIIKNLTVATFITVAFVTVTVIQIIKGEPLDEFLKTTLTMIVSFYFGTQMNKETPKGE